MTDVRQMPINMCHTTVEMVGVAAHVTSGEKFPIKSTRRRQRTPRRRKTVGRGPAFDRKWTPERYSSRARETEVDSLCCRTSWWCHVIAIRWPVDTAITISRKAAAAETAIQKWRQRSTWAISSTAYAIVIKQLINKREKVLPRNRTGVLCRMRTVTQIIVDDVRFVVNSKVQMNLRSWRSVNQNFFKVA